MTDVLTSLIFVCLCWLIAWPELFGRHFAGLVNKFERGYRSVRRG